MALEHAIAGRIAFCLLLSLWPGLSLGQDASAPEPFSPEDEWYLQTDTAEVRLYVKEIGGQDTRGNETGGTETGHGAPVVVLHGGFGAEHHYMLDLIAPHSRKQRFVFYDQRGSLRSPAPAASVSFQSHLADLETLRAELGLDSMTLLAHSAGTLLAMAYLKAHPQRVRELILVAPVKAQSAMPKNERGEPVVKPFAIGKWAQREEFWETMRENKLLTPEKNELKPDLTDRQKTHAWRISYAAANLFDVGKWRKMKGGQVFYSQVAANATSSTAPEKYDYLAVIANQDAAVTVIQGDHDIADWGGAYWRWAATQTDKINYRPVANAGHNAWIDEAHKIQEILDTKFDQQ